MESKPNFWAVLPANVRYCKALPPMARILYAEISSLCNKEGYCFAGNEYFSELYETTPRSIQNWLAALAKERFISIELDPAGGPRKIWIVAPGMAAGRGGDEKIFTPSPMKKLSGGDEKIFTHNSKTNSIPPSAPEANSQEVETLPPNIPPAAAWMQTATDFLAGFGLSVAETSGTLPAPGSGLPPELTILEYVTQLNDWVAEHKATVDNWKALARYRGEIEPELVKFCSHYATVERANFRAKPSAFFQRKFPGWLVDAASKEAQAAARAAQGRPGSAPAGSAPVDVVPTGGKPRYCRDGNLRVGDKIVGRWKD
jgi:hypothetical protein